MVMLDDLHPLRPHLLPDMGGGGRFLRLAGLFLQERLGRVQVVGLLIALTAIVLMTV
jgi:hypothetical protein